MKEAMKKLFELAAGREVSVFDTTYGALYAVKGCDIRLEHYFKTNDYNCAVITDANAILADFQF